MTFQDLNRLTLSDKAPPTPRYYFPDYKEPIPTVGFDEAAFASWMATAEGILARPHASSVLYRGGLLWRIALKIRPQLMQEVTRGPSSAAVLFVRRQDLGNDRLVETISQDEINLLLGQAKPGKGPVNQGFCTYFPMEAQFFGMVQWQGYWDEKCERWFEHRWNEISNNAPRLSENTWKSKTKTAKRLPKYGPALQLVLQEIQRMNGVSWLDIPFKDLKRDCHW